MLLLTLRDLQYRAVRFAIVVVATGVVFALLLLMSGLAEQLSNESFDAVDEIGADAWVVPVGVSGPFTSAVTIDPSIATAVPGVERADPLVVARGTLRLHGANEEVMLIGHVPGGVGAPRPALGSAALRDDEIVADETIGLKVGDTARIGTSDFRVVGVTRRTTVLAGVPFVFLRIDQAQRIVYRGAEAASAIVTRGIPTEAPAGTHAMRASGVALDVRRPLEQAIESINLIRVLLWIVSAMIIGGIIYLSAMERRRDFAVLKAIGARTRPILGGLALQGALVALAAAMLATVVQLVLAPTFPMKIRVSGALLFQLPIVAVVVATIASAAGMRQVARVDPATSFS